MWTITYVNEDTSSTGKTIRCLLNHPDFGRDVTLYSNIPVEYAPRKWDRITSTDVKVGQVETEWENTLTGETGVYKTPQRQITFWGEIEMLDPAPLPETKFVDKRTNKSNPASSTADDDQPF